MKIFKNKNKLQKEIIDIKNISFIPTMGGLHKGHISIIKKSKKFKGKSLVSIFVNPKQFNNKKDFKTYPRNTKKDLKILKRLKVNYVYIPNFNDIYSFKPKKEIFKDKFFNILCGRYRIGHFEGVLNVVNRLLEIVKPKYLFLGEKDMQQLFLIKKHIFKRNIKTQVISCKTVREKNGIACSTRNQNLNVNQLYIASKVYRFFKINKKYIKNKKIKFDEIKLKKTILSIGVSSVDYIEIYNPKFLKKPKNIKENFKIFFAYYLGKVRLIDNI